jgi:hypothetical protein
MKPGGLLQPLSIDISMDFIGGLPMTARKFDSIWMIIDRLSKSTHFIPVMMLEITWRSTLLTFYACTE